MQINVTEHLAGPIPTQTLKLIVLFGHALNFFLKFSCSLSLKQPGDL